MDRRSEPSIRNSKEEGSDSGMGCLYPKGRKFAQLKKEKSVKYMYKTGVTQNVTFFRYGKITSNGAHGERHHRRGDI